MASTVNEIIKETFEKLREEHLTFTPDNYQMVFCQVAKKEVFWLKTVKRFQNI